MKSPSFRNSSILSLTLLCEDGVWLRVCLQMGYVVIDFEYEGVVAAISLTIFMSHVLLNRYLSPRYLTLLGIRIASGATRPTLSFKC